MNNRDTQHLHDSKPLPNTLAEIELTDFKQSPPRTRATQTEPVSLELAKPTIPLIYLNIFKENEIAALEKQYNTSRYALDSLITQYKARYRFDFIRYLCDTGTNIPWIYYNIMTGKAGIQGFAQIVSPDTNVPDDTANTIGASLSTTGTLSFIFFYSPSKNAAKSTLEYATSDPIIKRVLSTFDAAKKHPVQAAKDSATYLWHASLIGTTYVTVGMAEIIPFMDSFNQMPTPAKWLTMGLIEYFACRYMDSYMTKQYFEGVAFWKNEQNKKYLIQRIIDDEAAISTYALYQILSTLGLRAFPNYYFMAVSASKALGYYIPAPIVSALVGIHGMFSLYPTTYNHYISSTENTEKILKNAIDLVALQHAITSEINLRNPSHINTLGIEHLKKFIIDKILDRQLPLLSTQAQLKLNREAISERVRKKLAQLTAFGTQETEQHAFILCVINSVLHTEKLILHENIKQEIGYLGLFKQEPWNALTVSWQGAIGAYFGAKFLAPLLLTNPPTALIALSGIAGAALFSGFTYHAETNRVATNLAYKVLEKPKQQNSKAITMVTDKKQTGSEKAAQILAAGLVTAYAASSTISTIGSNSLIGTPSPLLNTVIASAATQSGLNSISYMHTDVATTLTGVISGTVESFQMIHDYFRPNEHVQKLNPQTPNTPEPTRLTTTPATLFSTRQPDCKNLDQKVDLTPSGPSIIKPLQTS